MCVCVCFLQSMKFIKINIIPGAFFSPRSPNGKPMFKSCKNNKITSVSEGHRRFLSSLVFALILISAPLAYGLKALNDNVSHHVPPQATKREQ